MADGERRMLFDIRGRRKHVVKVVYAILALLMGASLFLVVGPFNLGELVNGGSTADNGGEIFEEQAERVEQRLRKTPDDADMLLSLTRARINAAAAESERDPQTGETVLTGSAKAQYAKADEAWQAYLKAAGDEVSPSLANQVAGAAFAQAQNSTSYEEAFEFLAAAADGPAHLGRSEAEPRLADHACGLRVPRRQDRARGSGRARKPKRSPPNRSANRSRNRSRPTKNRPRNCRKRKRKRRKRKRAKAKKPSKTRSAASAAAAAPRSRPSRARRGGGLPLGPVKTGRRASEAAPQLGSQGGPHRSPAGRGACVCGTGARCNL